MSTFLCLQAHISETNRNMNASVKKGLFVRNLVFVLGEGLTAVCRESEMVSGYVLRVYGGPLFRAEWGGKTGKTGSCVTLVCYNIYPASVTLGRGPRVAKEYTLLSEPQTFVNTYCSRTWEITSTFKNRQSILGLQDITFKKTYYHINSVPWANKGRSIIRYFTITDCYNVCFITLIPTVWSLFFFLFVCFLRMRVVEWNKSDSLPSLVDIPAYLNKCFEGVVILILLMLLTAHRIKIQHAIPWVRTGCLFMCSHMFSGHQVISSKKKILHL